MSVYGYTRVSTAEQGESGLGLEAQEAAILAVYSDAKIQREVASGGRTANRPVLQGLRTSLRRGDTLVVAKLDRLTRSLGDWGRLVEEAQHRGWNLVVLDAQFDLSTPTGEAMAGMLAVFAQLERRMISQRTKEGLAAKRARGWNPSPVTPATRRQVIKRWRSGASITDVTRALGLHRETAVRILRQETGQRSGRLVREVNSRVERNPR